MKPNQLRYQGSTSRPITEPINVKNLRLYLCMSSKFACGKCRYQGHPGNSTAAVHLSKKVSEWLSARHPYGEPKAFKPMPTQEIRQPLQECELESHFKQKYESNGPLGPSPSRRRAYGYITPADHYEITIRRLVNEQTKWLDVGAGKSPFPDNPKLSKELSDRSLRFVGVDPSENVKQNPYVQEHFCGNLEDYKNDERFDLITLRMVAEHVENPTQLVNELSNRILPGGIIVILTVWKFAPVTMLARILPFALHHPVKKIFWGGDESDTFPTIYRMNTKRSLRKLFFDFGFNESHLCLLGDCSVTGLLGNLNHVELLAWRGCKSIGVNYPESCILGLFRKNSAENQGSSSKEAASPQRSSKTEP